MSNFCPHCGTPYVCKHADFCIECGGERVYDAHFGVCTPLQYKVLGALSVALPLLTFALTMAFTVAR